MSYKLREQLIIFFFIAPFVAGGILNRGEPGVWGVLKGGAAGLGLAYFAAAVLVVCFIALVGIPREIFVRIRRRRALEPHFGRYWRSGADEAWRRVATERRAGDAVSGKVVVVIGDEVVIDLGAGFPASLHAFGIPPGATGEPPIPAVGDVVAAKIETLDEVRRTIVLTGMR